MAGQHRWSPGAALTVADLVALAEPEWPTDDPDSAAWIARKSHMYRQASQTRDASDHLRSHRPPIPPPTVPYHVGDAPDRDGRHTTPGRGGAASPTASGRGPTHLPSIMITLARNPQGRTVVISRSTLPPIGSTRPQEQHTAGGVR